MCTYKGCEKQAVHPQYDGQGVQWCDLCSQHCQELKEAVDNPNPIKILGVWARCKHKTQPWYEISND